jgi:hypothetical protein
VSVIPIDDIAYQANFWCPAGLQIETFGLELYDRSLGCPLRLMSLFVKGFGCRPLTSAAACTGGRRPKASKGGNRGKGYEGRAAGSMGICLWRVNLKSEFQRRLTSGATTTLKFWHECCEWVKAPFSSLVISNSYALQKERTFQLLR